MASGKTDLRAPNISMASDVSMIWVLELKALRSAPMVRADAVHFVETITRELTPAITVWIQLRKTSDFCIGVTKE